MTLGASSYAYATAGTSNRLLSTAGPAPARTYSYDAAGNLTGNGTLTFTYLDDGRADNGAVGGVYVVVTRYNGLGQRVFKSGTFTPRFQFFYDEAGRLLGEYARITPVREYVYLGEMPVAVLTDNASVLDNTATGTAAVGTWPSTIFDDPAYGDGYSYRSHSAGSGANSFTWTPSLAASGPYRVYARWTAGADRATNATYQVSGSAGTTNVTVNQQQQGGQWVLLGTFTLASGQGHNVRLTDNANGLVVAEAVKFVPADASTVYSIQTDHLNTPRALRSSAGVVVWRWDSDPFGATAPNEDPDGDGIAFSFPLRFPGQYADKETNTHYNYFRDYDPTIGRYVQSDPIGLAGGSFSTYAYVHSDPLRSSDFFGLQATCGTGAGAPFTPNTFFASCCGDHDACYDDCVNLPSKDRCDNDFQRCAFQQCSRRWAAVKFACEALAESYYQAVRRGGQTAFNNARAACAFGTCKP